MESHPMPVERDDQNGSDMMAQHFNDVRFKTYNEGPGRDLTEMLEAGDTPNDKIKVPCGIFLKFIPTILQTKGIENLCKKYGTLRNVNPVDLIRTGRTTNKAKVWFESVADAESAIRSINLLRSEKNGKIMGIHAEFQKTKFQTEDESDRIADIHLPRFVTPVKIDQDQFDYPLGMPVSLDSFAPEPLLRKIDFDNFEMLQEFGDPEMAVILDESVNSGKSTTDAIPSTCTLDRGNFDQEKEFIHNDQLGFTTTMECKNCSNPTIKFCKGCKEHFCSLFCLKQYNEEKNGCGCDRSGTGKYTETAPKRYAVGRGGKLIPPRVISPTPSTYSQNSSPDSDTKSVKSSRLNRILADLRCQEERNNAVVIGTIESCDLPRNNESVMIANVVSDKVVFLRSTKNDESYLKYLNDVAESVKTARMVDMPKKGDIVAAEFEGCYYRALIARIVDNEAVVVLVDLGKVFKIPSKTLRELREDLKHVKRFAFKTILNGVNEGLKSDKCLSFLHNLMSTKKPLKFIGKGNVSPSSQDIKCELMDSITNESVNENVITLNRITAGDVVMESDLPVKRLDANETEFFVIANSFHDHGLYTIVSTEGSLKLFLMHERIQEYCKADHHEPYTPQLNEICLAKCGYNGQWYRVKLDTSYGDKNPVMLFVDFQIYNKVHVTNMRPMPVEFKFPLYSHLAEISGIEILGNEAMPFKVKGAKVQDVEEAKIFVDTPIKLRKYLLQNLNILK